MMSRRSTHRILEFVLWVVAASGMITAGSLVVGLVLGGNLNTGKHILFVVGFLLFGVGSFLLQPSRPTPDFEHPRRGNSDEVEASQDSSNSKASRFEGPWKRGFGPSFLRVEARSESPREYRFEAMIQKVGPLAARPLPLDQRIGRQYKIFVTGLVVLAFSLAMEVAGIHV